MPSSENKQNVRTPSSLSNVAAERAVLAGICKYGIDVYVEISILLDENTFTVEQNKVLYKCVHSILQTSNTVDFASVISVATQLDVVEYLTTNENLKHVRAIFETPINIDNVYEQAARIRRLQFGREIQGRLREIYQDVNKITGDETVSQILALAETPLQTLSTEYIREDNNTPFQIGDNLEAYILHLIENPCTQVGLPTGMPAYDKAIGGGLRRKCVDVVGSRTGVGKSVFCDNVAIHVTRQDVPVLVLDTEMSEEDHYNRMIANLAGIDINEIATGQFVSDEDKKRRVLLARDELRKLPYYYINVSGRPFDETLSIIRRWLLKVVGYDENSRMNDCLVIYDYLKLMSSNELSDLKEYQMLGFQITKLHNLAVEYDFPCLTFTQLNRDGITSETTAVVSGSDRIIWLCTSFCLLKVKTEEEIATDGIRAGNRKLVCLKSRHGGGSEEGGYVCLQMEGKYARLVHLGSVRELNTRQEFPQRTGHSEEEDGEELESDFT